MFLIGFFIVGIAHGFERTGGALGGVVGHGKSVLRGSVIVGIIEERTHSTGAVGDKNTGLIKIVRGEIKRGHCIGLKVNVLELEV